MARIKYKEAVGLEVKRGRPTTSRKPGKAELKRLYVKESRSIREAAEILGCSKDMVYESLKEYGIERRSRIKKSKLSSHNINFLIEEVNKKGYRKTAHHLGISTTALWSYMKRRKKF